MNRSDTPRVKSRTAKPLRLKPDHPAVAGRRSLFYGMVRDDWPHVLVDGVYNKKIGGKVKKGRLFGLPLYTVTLQERATCPPDCHHFLTCYGNRMNRARRHVADEGFVVRLGSEIVERLAASPDGIMVRVHVLGDFFSEAYVEAWAGWLREHPKLRVWGYTAWKPDSEIGKAVAALPAEFGWDRAAIRFSGGGMAARCAVPTSVASARGRTPDGVVCPAQTDPEEKTTCSTCALCWASEGNVVFIDH